MTSTSLDLWLMKRIFHSDMTDMDISMDNIDFQGQLLSFKPNQEVSLSWCNWGCCHQCRMLEHQPSHAHVGSESVSAPRVCSLVVLRL